MHEVYKRVSNWNAARYDRELNVQLSIDLLREEIQEFVDATTTVEELDALCDITFVCMGIVWKCDASLKDVSIAQDHVLVTMPPTFHHFGMTLDQQMMMLAMALTKESALYIALTVAHIAGCAANGYLYIAPDRFIRAVNIVCDSNDTKSIKKTPAYSKANIDKGPFYVAPTVALQQLLNEVQGNDTVN